MAQLGILRDDIYHLKNTIREHKRELSHLHFKNNLAKNSWRDAKEEINYLKEDIHELTIRLNSFELEREDWRASTQCNSEEKDAIGERVGRVEYALGEFTQLHLQLKQVVATFKNKAAKILKTTLKIGNNIKEEELKLELLVD